MKISIAENDRCELCGKKAKDFHIFQFAINDPTFTCGRHTEDEVYGYMKQKYWRQLWAMKKGHIDQFGRQNYGGISHDDLKQRKTKLPDPAVSLVLLRVRGDEAPLHDEGRVPED